MQSTYWLEKVLKMISLYVNALLCTLQHIFIHAMQLSGVNSEGVGQLIVTISRCHMTRHINTAGLLWTSDQLVTEAATYTRHNKNKTRKSITLAGFEPAIPVIGSL
jgi:hypothetical protein